MPSKQKNELLANVRQRTTSAPAAIQKGDGYRVGVSDTPIVLAPELQALSLPLQNAARAYLGARRRSGAALLEAARFLAEARALAQHGEWQVFLDGTHTSADTAERLINIHTRATQDPQFEAAVKDDWLSQTSAALLARPSTPPEVVTELLNAPTPPTQAQITRRTRQVKQPPQIPQNADFGTVDIPQHAESAGLVVAQVGPEQRLAPEATLAEITRVLVHLTRDAHQLTSNPALLAALGEVELALHDLRRAVGS